MVNTEKICFWKNRGTQILKVENEKMETHIIHLKKELHKKNLREIILTLRKNMTHVVIKFQCLKL